MQNWQAHIRDFLDEDKTFDRLLEEALSSNPPQSMKNAPGQRTIKKETKHTKSYIRFQEVWSNGTT